MANEVKIILTATDKASATLSGFGNKIKGMGSGLDNTLKSLTGFGLGSFTAAAAIGAVAKGVGDSIKLFTTYAEQVRTMSAATGMSNEETSKMIQVFDDANVEIGLFTAAARKMVQNGIQPSIENISKLADEYNALKDPVAKSKLLLDNFGRSGLAMGKLMAGGAKGILESAEAAERFGLVLDDKAIASAEEYRVALDDLNDAGQGLKITLGKELVPVLADVANEVNRVISEHQESNEIINKLDEAVKAHIITEGQMRDIWDKLVESGGDYNAITSDMLVIEVLMRDERQESITLLRQQKKATDDLTEATDEETKIYGQVLGALQASNVAMTVKIGLERELALAAGKTTKEQLALDRAITSSTQALELGFITATTYKDIMDKLATGVYTSEQAVKALKRAIDALKDKKVTITTIFVETGRGNRGRQFGGPVAANVPYLVGEAGPELFVPSSSGKIVPNNQIGKGGGSGAGISIGEINVYASESMDEQSLAQLVIARLAAATRNSGYAGLDYAG